jgi:hypothetical protein
MEHSPSLEASGHSAGLEYACLSGTQSSLPCSKQPLMGPHPPTLILEMCFNLLFISVLLMQLR